MSFLNAKKPHRLTGEARSFDSLGRKYSTLQGVNLVHVETKNRALSNIQLNVAGILVKNKRAQTLCNFHRKRKQNYWLVGRSFGGAAPMISFGKLMTCSHASIFAFVTSM